MYSPGGLETGIIRKAIKAEALTFPPNGLVYHGSTDKNNIYIAVDIQPGNLLEDLE